jgi:hypothetical protein
MKTKNAAKNAAKNTTNTKVRASAVVTQAAKDLKRSGGICFMDGCNRKARSKGRCSKHYQAYRRVVRAADARLRKNGHLPAIAPLVPATALASVVPAPPTATDEARIAAADARIHEKVFGNSADKTLTVLFAAACKKLKVAPADVFVMAKQEIILEALDRV